MSTEILICRLSLVRGLSYIPYHLVFLFLYTRKHFTQTVKCLFFYTTVNLLENLESIFSTYPIYFEESRH